MNITVLYLFLQVNLLGYLFHHNGFAIGRFECSFYGSSMKTLETYKKIITTLYPRSSEKYNRTLINYPCFSKVPVEFIFN